MDSQNPLLSSSPEWGAMTKRLDSETIVRLRECDEITRYRECGWFCAIGIKAGKTHVMVHANSDAEINRALEPGEGMRGYNDMPSPWDPHYG